MTDGADLAGLVARWVDGWCAVRRFDDAVRRRDGALEVAVGARSRRLELVVADPAPGLLQGWGDEVAAAGDVWLTVMADGSVAPPAGLVVLTRDEVLMTRTLVAAPAPAGPRCEVEADGDRACARVVVDGEVASQGWVGVRDGVAVHDRIETAEAHRRRGLGATVMSTLDAWALDRGATWAVLAATAQGRALYARLGWEVVARMTTFAAPPALDTATTVDT